MAAAASSHDESDQSLYHETPVFRAFEQASLGQPSNFALSSTSLEASSSRPAAPRQAGLTTSSKTLVETRSGRSPWYGLNGLPSEAYVIGVAGGSASGKTSVASRVLTKLNVPTVAVVSQDSFYKPLNPEQSKMAFSNNWNFDCEAAFDQDLLKQCIIDLKNCKAVEVPVYSFAQHQRVDETKYLYGASVVIVEGLFVLSDPELRSLLDLKIYVQADSDLMLARRITRDTRERGRDVHGIIEHYLRWVKPAMDNSIQPTAKWADLIVPGQSNDVAVDVVAQHVKRQLDARAMRLRSELSKTPMTPAAMGGAASYETLQSALISRHFTGLSRTPSTSSLSDSHADISNNLTQAILPASVHLLPPTPQLLGLLTIMHDASTAAADFVFYTDRVCQILMEAALSFLPYREKVVECGGTGRSWSGKVLDTDKVCTITIQRSGSVLENAARRAIPALTQGSLLIQSSQEDGEPQLYDVRLPDSLRRRSTAVASHVLLLDAQIGTGAAAFMAIRVMLDHCVPQENIIFVSILASAKGGIWALARAFPQVKIVLAGVDGGLKKYKIEYPRLTSSAGSVGKSKLRDGEDLEDATAALAVAAGATSMLARERRDEDEDDDDDGQEDDLSRSRRKTKTIWAITPGMGSIGDRYWRTD